MCKPSSSSRREVVVVGAGPAGLLVTLLLLQRNEKLEQESSSLRYHVTLVDGRQDFGLLDPETDLKKFRSWMLGLASHGLTALREIPELYNDYVTHVGVRLEAVALHFGAKEIKVAAGSEGDDTEGYIVDRNFIVAALARFLRDKYQDSPYLTTHYKHQLLYVDHEHDRVLVRNTTSSIDSESYLPYDLLMGCDGLRSVVREALVKMRPDFEMDIGDIFQEFKAVHVKCPENVDPKCMHILPHCFSYMTGIGLPETGGVINISIGGPRHTFDKIAKELKSSDPEVVAEFMEKNFKPFRLDDYMDFAKQWVNQKWNRTGMVHCNIYHSGDSVCIMGDAAHATSPSIGMGMNQALRDAQTFCQLLEQNKDDLATTLEAFSNARVKEGNSLTDLAMHLYCLDDNCQLLETIHTVLRGALSSIGLATKHPQQMIGLNQYMLSDVYDVAFKLGIISRHKRINARIRQEYFERTTGMTKPDAGLSRWIWMTATAGILIALAWVAPKSR
jgi:kynurenine 3-monooxygenase